MGGPRTAAEADALTLRWLMIRASAGKQALREEVAKAITNGAQVEAMVAAIEEDFQRIQHEGHALAELTSGQLRSYAWFGREVVRDEILDAGVIAPIAEEMLREYDAVYEKLQTWADAHGRDLVLTTQALLDGGFAYPDALVIADALCNPPDEQTKAERRRGLRSRNN